MGERSFVTKEQEFNTLSEMSYLKYTASLHTKVDNAKRGGNYAKKGGNYIFIIRTTVNVVKLTQLSEAL